jgi:hypothetical protein
MAILAAFVALPLMSLTTALPAVAENAARTTTTATAAAATASTTPMSARPANEFLDSLGVDTHLLQADTPFGQRPADVAAALTRLGIRHVRDAIPPDGDPAALARLQTVAATGIHFDFIAPRPAPNAASDAGRITPFVAEISKDFASSTEQIEGPNEYDNQDDATWPTVLKRYQKALATAVRSDPDANVRSLPLLAPSLVGAKMADRASSLAGITAVDAGNLHVYPLGAAPEASALDERTALTRRYISGPTAPIFVTEAGYHNALNTTQPGHPPIPESVGGSYTTRLFLDNFRKGIARTYAYELVDEGANRVDASSVDDTARRYREANFGLLRFDFSEKPAATAVRNLTTILADGSTPFTPGPLDVGIDNAPSDLHTVLLEKSDGSFYLALWRPSSLWDRQALVRLDPADTPLTVRLDHDAELAVYRPTAGADPVTQTEANAVTLGVGADPVILRVGNATRPSAPTDVSADPRDGAAAVSWSAVPGATSYTVTTDPATAPVVVPADPGADRPGVTVTGLTNATTYRFAVTATNPVGTGPASPWSDPVVPTAAPTPPHDASAVVAGSGAMTVGWTPPDSGATPTGYTVTVSPGARTMDVPAGPDGTPTSARIDGLTDGTAYTFAVTATNAFGTSAASEPTAPLLSGIPSAPTAVGALPGERSATVSWLSPPTSAPTGYQVTASPGGATVAAAGDARSVVVPGLSDGTAYSFTVVAANAAGPSAASAASAPVVPGPPGSPTGVTAVAGNGSATVSWTPPAGAPVTGYTVLSSPGGVQATIGQPEDGSALPTSTLVSGLVNGTTYTFSAVATNTVGSGSPSAPSAAVRPVGPPVTVQEDAASVRIGGWGVLGEAGAGGGSVRVSTTTNDTAALTATGTSLSAVLRTGPDRGRAAVLVDGTVRATVELYAPTRGTVTKAVTGLTNRSHTISVRVVGTKASASTGTGVALDGFRIGNTVVDDGDRRITLSGWLGVSSSSASGGGLRVQRAAGSRVTVAFTGTGISWLGARGPAYGRARVLLDGVVVSTGVDAYARAQSWKATLFDRTVPLGAHTLIVEATGTKSAASTAADVPVDAFVVRP